MRSGRGSAGYLDCEDRKCPEDSVNTGCDGRAEVRGCSIERKFSKTWTDGDAVLLEWKKAHLELNLKQEEKGGERNMAEEERRGSGVKGKQECGEGWREQAVSTRLRNSHQNHTECWMSGKKKTKTKLF